MSFNDSLILHQGLEYKAKLPCGHVVHYLSRDCAKAYAEARGAEVIAPAQGPHIPDCLLPYLNIQTA